jgi:SAM-dependent methyltransferase
VQHCVLEELFANYSTRDKALLHFAPEPMLSRYLHPRFASHTTTDIKPEGVDMQSDIRKLQFADASFDVVFASHVLEHIDDDRTALQEVYRVLRPGGLAILPVPIFGSTTIEYPFPCAAEHYHVRAPGADYFDRYRKIFPQVDVKSSEDYAPKYQVFVYEDRSAYPTEACPFRQPVAGTRHLEYVPICYR